jgi:hypothetical protein
MHNFLSIAYIIFVATVLVSSCGYRVVGSRLLPFDSVTIKSVKNDTYEPRLEEKMHTALSREFINQGIEVKAANGDIDLHATITTYALGAIAAVDETVKEQEVIMYVDIKLSDGENVKEFKRMQSPIKITFQSTGAVSEAVVRQEDATVKASREIAKEIVSSIILRYAK